MEYFQGIQDGTIRKMGLHKRQRSAEEEGSPADTIRNRQREIGAAGNIPPTEEEETRRRVMMERAQQAKDVNNEAGGPG